jgi:hypothetical protein
MAVATGLAQLVRVAPTRRTHRSLLPTSTAAASAASQPSKSGVSRTGAASTTTPPPFDDRKGSLASTATGGAELHRDRNAEDHRAEREAAAEDEHDDDHDANRHHDSVAAHNDESRESAQQPVSSASPVDEGFSAIEEPAPSSHNSSAERVAREALMMVEQEKQNAVVGRTPTVRKPRDDDDLSTSADSDMDEEEITAPAMEDDAGAEEGKDGAPPHRQTTDVFSVRSPLAISGGSIAVVEPTSAAEGTVSMTDDSSGASPVPAAGTAAAAVPYPGASNGSSSRLNRSAHDASSSSDGEQD